MSKPVRLASFCRLCLSKTKDKVPVFAEGNLLENLLRLIEIEIDENNEPDAVVCYDCVVTLEGFHQFKEQCHVNDEFVKTIPPKADNSGSSGGEEEDDDREESVPDEDGGLEEEDRLELSEAEEVFQELPSPPAKSAKSKRKAAVASPKNSPAKKPATPVQAKKRKMEQSVKDTSPKTSLDEMQVLQESYPDYFYFEKGSRSIYYTLIYYGERYNSAIFAERTTYWQCIHRRKYACSAQVRVSNDYKTFERFYEHTHKQLKEKEGQAFTPHEALPELFKICKRIVEQKKIKQYNTKQEIKKESFASQFEEFAEVSMRIKADEGSSPADKKKKYSEIYSSDSEADPDASSEVPLIQEPKPSSKNVQRKKPTVKEPKSVIKPKANVSKYDDDSDSEPDEEKILDLEQIEQECDALNVPKRPSYGPSLEEMLVLQDSYPDFFFFEKGPRSIYFTLVYYGERFHSALFTERYTYWQCRHRRKYRCPAQVCVTNDYKTFERRYEHSHPELPDKEGQAFTPKEALPELFEACRKIVHKNRAKRRQKLLHKYQFLNSINGSEDQPSNDSGDVNQDDLIEVVDDDDVDEETPTKELEYEELIEED